MATRSAIGLVTDRFIYGIYCHWDGYPSNNGKILIEHYNSVAKVWDLIEPGNLSALSETTSTCTYYGRDMRPETRASESYTTFNSRDEFLEHFLRPGCEFFYLFEDGKWMLNRNSAAWTRFMGWEELSV